MNVGSSTMNDDKKTYFQQIRYFGTMGSLIFFSDYLRHLRETNFKQMKNKTKLINLKTVLQ